MSKLIVLMSDNPECIEGFSSSCKRSKEGALHLLPKKAKTVSDDEFNFIKEHRKEVYKNLRLLGDKPDQKPQAEAKPEGKADAKADEKVGKSEAQGESKEGSASKKKVSNKKK